ncbi:HSP20-like chaperone [Schizopora paradoxa]|uniref:HSP20-like chaperone n=1 Tax=Schizopora paradoxa TaxID=27342 RepID=A0A0H2R6R1_9AGAM|nr:HSP20-like chaperone [Schizopora paradoxa]
MAVHPEIRWAQRSSETEAEKNIVFLSVNLPEIKESSMKLDITEKEISFAADAGRPEERKYEFKLKLFGEVDPEKTQKRLTTRSLELVLRKKDMKSEFWARLSEEKKVPFVKTDFDRWVDEDEQDGAEDPNLGAGGGDDMDFGGMGGMPGMGGMGGMPGMPGMPGMGGMGGMPGMPGMGGGPPGGMDFEKMMAEFKEQNKGGAGGIDDADSDSDDDDGPPPLEDAEPVAGSSA